MTVLEEKAAEAWALMARAADPMPYYVARDWLMEQANCERETAVEALVAVAVEWLRAVPVPQDDRLTSKAKSVCAALTGGRLLGAATELKEIRRAVEPQFGVPSVPTMALREQWERLAPVWAPWIAAAVLAVRLVRELSEGT